MKSSNNFFLIQNKRFKQKICIKNLRSDFLNVRSIILIIIFSITIKQLQKSSLLAQIYVERETAAHLRASFLSILNELNAGNFDASSEKLLDEEQQSVVIMNAMLAIFSSQAIGTALVIDKPKTDENSKMISTVLKALLLAFISFFDYLFCLFI